MKLEALDHPKTLDLAARLNVEIPTAIGYLELLWAFTGRKAPQGDIGKWPDGAIARACYWNADPTVFVTALVTAGFLDAHPQYRLVVHDWQDHAPRWVLAKLARSKLKLIDCSRKYRSDSSGDYLTNQPALRADYSGHYSGDSVSEVKGSEGKGSQGKGDARGKGQPLADARATDAQSGGGERKVSGKTVAVAETPPAGQAGAEDAARPAGRKPSRSERATRIPDDWPLTEARRQVALTEGLDPERTHAKFCDYWRARSGQNARKLDWEATWRNWCRTEADRSRSNGATTPAARRETYAERVRREWLEEQAAKDREAGDAGS